MQWLQQNWAFLALGVGVLYLFMRRGGGMGCGMGGGGHDGLSHGHGSAGPSGSGLGRSTAQAIDPVSGRHVDPSTAVSTVYRGAPVYFESRENRDRFEALPEQFRMTTGTSSHVYRHRGC